MRFLTGPAFYWFDITLAGLIPLVVLALIQTDCIDSIYGRGFVLGCGLGLLWELPLHFLGPSYTETPLFTHAAPWPLHPLGQPFLHSLWDGGLLVTGLGLAVALRGSAVLQSIDTRAIAILTAWGLGTELIVEWLAAGRGWSWIPRPYSPTLFSVRGEPVLLLPILVWAVAPAIYYLLFVPLYTSTTSNQR